VRRLALALLVACTAHHNALGRDGVGCGGRAHDDAVRALLLHNRWNVFTSADDYVVWEVAPARLSDGSVVDLWRNETEIAWAVPMGAEPPNRRGRWRAFPYTAERAPAAERAFWGALCDEYERADPQRRAVVGFHFYMMQADARPMEAGGGELYGQVSKRLIKSFDCAARGSFVD